MKSYPWFKVFLTCHSVRVIALLSLHRQEFGNAKVGQFPVDPKAGQQYILLKTSTMFITCYSQLKSGINWSLLNCHSFDLIDSDITRVLKTI